LELLLELLERCTQTPELLRRMFGLEPADQTRVRPFDIAPRGIGGDTKQLCGIARPAIEVIGKLLSILV
jgi:hypothetical protein